MATPKGGIHRGTTTTRHQDSSISNVSKSAFLRHQTHLHITESPTKDIERLDYNIYHFMDNGQPEIIHSLKTISLFRYLKKTTYSDIRQSFRIVRAKEREEKQHGLLNSIRDILAHLNQDRLLLKKYLQVNGWILEFISFFIEIMYSISYLMEMQYNYSNPCTRNGCNFLDLPSWILVNRLPGAFIWLVGGSLINILLITLNGMISDNPLKYFLRPRVMIDFITSLPFIVLSRVENGHHIYIPYFLRCFLLIPNLKAVLRMKHKWSIVDFSDLTEKLIVLFAYLWTMIFFGTCTFNYSETQFPGQPRGGTNENLTANLTLLDTIYFIVITISTVGYGDITPKTVPGQITIMILIFAGISILPGLVTDMQESIRVQASGAGEYTPGKNPFIVICGHFTDPSRISDFIRTIMSKDRDQTALVLLCREKLSAGLKYLLKSSKLKGRVFYFIGSGLETRDLQRVKLDRASGAMILANLTSDMAKKEDEHNTLRAWSFYDFAPHVPLYVETLLPETDAMQEDFTNGSLCIHDFSQIFLAYNCIYRGVGTLMINLVRGSKRYTDFDEPWHAQYGDGASNQIFKEKLNPVFVGMSFSELSYYLYKEFQVVLFAIHVYVLPYQSRHVLLNPGQNYKIKENDYGFFISPSYEDVKATNLLTNSQFLRTITKKDTLCSFQPFSPSTTEIMVTSPQSPKELYRKGYPIINNYKNGISWLTSSAMFVIERATVFRVNVDSFNRWD